MTLSIILFFKAEIDLNSEVYKTGLYLLPERVGSYQLDAIAMLLYFVRAAKIKSNTSMKSDICKNNLFGKW